VGVIRSLLRRHPLFPLLPLILLAALGGLAFRDRGVVFPGVSIAGRRAAGLSQSAAAALAEKATPAGAVRLTLGSLSLDLRPEDLGVRFSPQEAVRKAWRAGRAGFWPRRVAQRIGLRFSPLDVRIPWSFDRERCRRTLAEIAAKLPEKPRNATATLSSGQVKIVPEQWGGTLGIDACMKQVESWAQSPGSDAIALQGDFEKPRVAAADLKDVSALMASFSTGLGSSSASRLHNVRLSAGAISGAVLMPGEVFSFNEMVGPRTPEAGYRTAPVLQHGLLVPGTGGGACQVSSTLYNAALLANLEVVKRYHHSQPVPYLAAGRDATVWYGTFDLKFRNPLDSPVVLHASVGRRTVTFSVLGKPLQAPVRVHSWRRWGRLDAAVVKADPSLPPGKRVVERAGKRAVMAVTTREVGEGPAAVQETVSRDYYAAVPAVIRVGPAAKPEEAAPPAAEEPAPGEPAGNFSASGP